MKQTYEKLPEAELDVMLALWKFSEPVRTSVLLGELSGQRSWTLSTLKVLLGRLVEKGYVEVTRDRRFTLYRALLPEAEYRQGETRGLARRFYEGSVKTMIAQLVQEEPLTAQEIRELEEILKRAGEHNG